MSTSTFVGGTYSTSGIFRVENVIIESAKSVNSQGDQFWQDIIIMTADGGTHVLSLFLESKAAALPPTVAPYFGE